VRPELGSSGTSTSNASARPPRGRARPRQGVDHGHAGHREERHMGVRQRGISPWLRAQHEARTTDGFSPCPRARRGARTTNTPDPGAVTRWLGHRILGGRLGLGSG
jgi:hypothetical protein